MLTTWEGGPRTYAMYIAPHTVKWLLSHTADVDRGAPTYHVVCHLATKSEYMRHYIKRRLTQNSIEGMTQCVCPFLPHAPVAYQSAIER